MVDGSNFGVSINFVFVILKVFCALSLVYMPVLFWVTLVTIYMYMYYVSQSIRQLKKLSYRYTGTIR